MKKFLYIATAVSVSIFVLFYILFRITQNDVIQALYITFMTFSYQFIMRLIVGTITYPILASFMIIIVGGLVKKLLSKRYISF